MKSKKLAFKTLMSVRADYRRMNEKGEKSFIHSSWKKHMDQEQILNG
jgi:hypothetical protein